MEETNIFKLKYKLEKLSLILMAAAILVVAIVSYAVNIYEESITCEECLQKCQDSYSLTIDNSWLACDDRCYKKYGKEQCNLN
tara:strand:+ start:53 stop:301 length:249 start_codon:yes stop_codon:yes gene_type:complete